MYGGYFGAAQGVLLMAILGIGVDETLQRLNAVKNVLAALVNAISGLIFVFVADVDWRIVLLIGVGSVIGGQLGATVGRRLAPRRAASRDRDRRSGGPGELVARLTNRQPGACSDQSEAGELARPAAGEASAMRRVRSTTGGSSPEAALSRRTWLGLALGGVLVVAGCGSDSNEFEPSEDQPNPDDESDENDSPNPPDEANKNSDD